MKIGLAILTQPGRFDALQALLSSISPNSNSCEDEFQISLKILSNGDKNSQIHDRKFTIPYHELEQKIYSSPDNLGVAGGRNYLIDKFNRETDFILFIDDDAILAQDFFSQLSSMVTRYPEYSIFSFNVFQFQHPHLLDCWPYTQSKSKYNENFRTTNFQGGACLIHSKVFEKIGIYWTELYYAHEEYELALRLQYHDVRIIHVATPYIFHNHSNINSHRGELRTYYSLRNRLLIISRHYPLKIKYLSIIIRLASELVTMQKSVDAAKYYFLAIWDAIMLIFVKKKNFPKFSHIPLQVNDLRLNELRLLRHFWKRK